MIHQLWLTDALMSLMLYLIFSIKIYEMSATLYSQSNMITFLWYFVSGFPRSLSISFGVNALALLARGVLALPTKRQSPKWSTFITWSSLELFALDAWLTQLLLARLTLSTCCNKWITRCFKYQSRHGLFIDLTMSNGVTCFWSLFGAWKLRHQSLSLSFFKVYWKANILKDRILKSETINNKQTSP